MKTWLVKVRCPDRSSFWMGEFQAPGRAEAKVEARRFVSQHLPLDTQVLAIAEGRLHITFNGPEVPL